MVYIPGGSKNYMIEKWQTLAEYLTKTTGIPVEVVEPKTYITITESFKKNKADIGYLSGFIYIKLKKDMDIIPLVKPLEKGKIFYKCYIIVRKNSGIKNIEELKNKRFSFVHKDSTSGYLFPRVMMANKGIDDPEDYFSKVELMQDHFSSLSSVYHGYVEGGVVSSFVFESKEAEKYIKDIDIIMETDEIPLGCFAVKSDLKPEYIKKLKEAFLIVNKTEETRELLKGLGVEGYVEAEDSDYDPIREAIIKLSSLKDIKESDIFK